MKATIKSIQEKGCVVTAKNWWAGLTPQEKAIAVTIIVSVGACSVFYFVFNTGIGIAALCGVGAGSVTYALASDKFHFDTVSKDELFNEANIPFDPRVDLDEFHQALLDGITTEGYRSDKL